MEQHELARLLVLIEDADGQPVIDAEVQLREADTNTPHEMKLLDTPGQAYGEDLTPGTYELRVSRSQRDLQPETQMLELTAGYNSATVILGKEGQPFFYAGETKVYFEPDRNSFLVVARGDGAAEVAPSLLRNQDLEVHPLPSILSIGVSGYEASSEQPSDSSFVSVELPGDQTADQAGELMESVANELQRRGLQVILALAVQRGERPVQGLTNELTVRFDDSVTQDEVERIARQLGLTVERPILYAGNAFLLSRPGPPSYDLLRIAQVLQQEFPVLYAEPNLLQQLEIDQFTPNDPLWANLTHLPWINCDDAWQTLGNINANMRGGSSNITIAVFDPHGVTPNHPDLTANLTDGTSKLVTSFDFNAMAPQTVAALVGDHGTQCAGAATAAFNNNQGIAGVAANCHLIGARIPSPATGIQMADAFIWAAGFNTGNTNPTFPPLPARTADVISNSWGVTGAPLSAAMRDSFDFLTVYGRGGRGCVVTFSVGNLGYVQFSNQRTFAAYERTIAVGASINVNPTSPVNSCQTDPNGNTNNINVAVDTRALYSPFGPEMDIVAPSHTAYLLLPGGGCGALIDPTTSTVRVGTGTLDGCPGPAVCNDYATTFGGTSHASPTIAGVAALVLTVNPSLSWVEVREILRTTAVRIDFANADPIGQWVDNDGDGVNEFSQWYGYGRVDANAAVTVTRDRTLAADIVVRENLADDGTVPSTGWHAHSPDVWVRRTNDPIPALAYTSDPPHQMPRRGQDNFVFCRVKNVGAAASNEVYIRAMITHYPGFEFRYPQEFVPTNRPGDPVPSPLRPGTYLIGEVRIDNIAPNANQIVKMTWPQALVPPETVTVNGVNVQWHPCLLLEASPHDGPMPAGATFDISRDNNIAQRNITILNPSDPATDLFNAVIVGTSDPSGVESLVIDRSLLETEAQVFFGLADTDLMKRLLVDVEREKEPCSIRLLTEARVAIECDNARLFTVSAPAGTRFDCSPSTGASALKVVSYQGLEVFEIGAGRDPIELPLRLDANQFTLLLVAVPRNRITDGGELRLTQRRGDGELSAGFTVIQSLEP